MTLLNDIIAMEGENAKRAPDSQIYHPQTEALGLLRPLSLKLKSGELFFGVRHRMWLTARVRVWRSGGRRAASEGRRNGSKKSSPRLSNTHAVQVKSDALNLDEKG
jgi:hypothetical protein